MGIALGFPGAGLNAMALGSPSLPDLLSLTFHPNCLGVGLWWLGRVTTGAGGGRQVSSAFCQESSQEGRKDVVFFYLSLRDPLGQRWKVQRLTGTREVT